MGVADLAFLQQLYVPERELPPIEPEPLSVCTPIYNAMPYLETYLQHVLLYDWPNDLTSIFFAVAGDDGTFEALKEFRKTYGDDYRRIKVKYVKNMEGGEMPHIRNVVHCRNLMARWSRPDKLVFYNDSDNFSPPVSIRRLYDGLRLGASGAAGIYMFRQFDNDGKERIGLTSFFLHNNTMRHLALPGREGLFPLDIFGKRLWMDAVSCGCFLVKRKLLDDVKFFVPTGTTMSDDTAFCLKARSMGHKFIADFGLFVPHWGYDVRHMKAMWLKVNLSEQMQARRMKNRLDGVYVHPELDANMNEAVRKHIDIDKIEQLVKSVK